MTGNDRFEGFAIDLMSEIAKFLQFNVTFKLVDDNKYGNKNEHGRWNGMIGDLANNRTDMAVQQITDNDKRRQESRSSSGISLHIEK